MKKVALLTLTLCFALSAIVGAQDTRMTPGIHSSAKGMKSNKTAAPDSKGEMCSSEGCATCEGESCSCDECPIMAKAMESLPKMVFKIGDEETCCHMTATKMAHDTHTRIEYVVGKNKYKNSNQAFQSLVKQTESYVKKFTTPKVCSESGKTTIAGTTCDCPVATAKLTELVGTKTKEMKLCYKVGEMDFAKYHDALKHAKKTHQKGMYVVEGEKFENEWEARLALAHKKFRSAVAAAQSVKTEVANQIESEQPETDSEPKTKVVSKDS